MMDTDTELVARAAARLTERAAMYAATVSGQADVRTVVAAALEASGLAGVVGERERVAKLEDALEPFALLAGGVNMNDPLSKWVTIAQLHAAKEALSPHPEGQPNDA